MTGVAWWLAPNRAAADLVLRRFVLAALITAVLAPLFSGAPPSRKLLFSVLAAAAVGVAY